MDKINLKYLLFILVILVSTIDLSAKEKLKNLYIIVEPTSVKFKLDKKGSVQSLLATSIRELTKVGDWISTQEGLSRFKNIIIRVAGDGAYFGVFNQTNAHTITRNHIFTKIFRNIYKREKYSIVSSLKIYLNDLENNRWKGSETLLAIFGDMDFVQDNISSHAGYLNSAWINNKNSIFQSFLNKNFSIAKDTSVVIFRRTQIKLTHEEEHKNFWVNIFDRAGMKVYHIDELYDGYNRHNNRKNRDNRLNSYAISVLDSVQNNLYKDIPIVKLKDTQRCQIIKNDKVYTEPDCGGY